MGRRRCIHFLSFLGYRMVHLTITAHLVGASDTIHFDMLEFPAPVLAGTWIPPIFTPSQTFHFGSLDFVADQLGVHRRRAHCSAPPHLSPPLALAPPRHRTAQRAVRGPPKASLASEHPKHRCRREVFPTRVPRPHAVSTTRTCPKPSLVS